MAAATKDQIIEAIGTMTMLEISDLIKSMEEKFGVTAAAPVAAAGAGGAPVAAVEEQTEFTVILKSGYPADKKISIIKEVRVVTGLGLKEAKDLVEAGDKPLKENVSKEEANKVAESIKAAGGTVEIK